MPLLFALYLAAVPRYGAQTGMLFGFLFLVDAGLSPSPSRGGRSPARDRRDGELLVFAIWLAKSYTTAAGAWLWPSRSSLRRSICSRRLPPTVCGVRSPGSAHATYMPRRPAVRVPGDCAHRTGGGAAAGSFAALFAVLAVIAWRALEASEAGLYFVGAFFAVAAEASWSATYLTIAPLAPRSSSTRHSRCSTWACPGLAPQWQAMYPAWGGGALLIASLGLLLFLAAGPQAAESLWGLALLLAIVNAGLFIESAAGAMPLLSVAGAVLSWIVLAVWWDRAAAAVGVLPSLLVLVGLTLVMLGGHAWTHATSARAGSAVARQSLSFRHGVYLALAGQFFLFFVAQNPQWAAPPWPLFGALAVMTLATTAASLEIGMPELHAGGVVAAALIAFSVSRASPGAWALTSLAATEAVVAYGVGTLILSARARQLPPFAASVGAFTALFVAEVGITNAAHAGDAALLAPSIVAHVINLSLILAIVWRRRWSTWPQPPSCRRGSRR